MRRLVSILGVQNPMIRKTSGEDKNDTISDELSQTGPRCRVKRPRQISEQNMKQLKSTSQIRVKPRPRPPPLREKE